MQSKEQLLFSLNSKIDTLTQIINKVLDNNIIDDHNKVYENIGDVLHWLGSCIDRIDETIGFAEDDKDFKIAFKGAANAQKHGVKLIKFDNFINCTRFPFVLDAVFSDKGLFLWTKLEDDVIRYKEQIKKYNSVLSGKDIIETINKMKNIIVKCFEKIK